MKKFIIGKNNIATTNHIDEYVGTIAIDDHAHLTMKKNIEEIQLVKKYLAVGYYFNGLRLNTNHTNYLVSEEKTPVDILLTKKKSDNTFDNIYVEGNVNLNDILLSLTGISLQFTNTVDFEKDNIDWKKLKKRN